MATVGIELCDAGFLAARSTAIGPGPFEVSGVDGSPEWPGFCHYDGSGYSFGRAAEDKWFVHPRQVAHAFWARLAHEPSTLAVGAKPPSSSELAFFFLREYVSRLNAVAGPIDQIVLALPGAYLKDAATEEEKIGLLLGMAGELRLPLAGVIDMACAAVCDPRAGGINLSLPILVLDLHLEGAELTLLAADERLERKDFVHLPEFGYAHLLKQLTRTMGNRFLRHTSFDILEDGQIEQTFFRQTKEFMLGGASEHRFLINTATRTYEMIATREYLTSDAHGFVTTLVQGVQSFLQHSTHASEPCTVVLTDRSARLPGLEARLRSAGFQRIVRLTPAAAACGAAQIGAKRMSVSSDLALVPVETAVPLADVHRAGAGTWEVHLLKRRNQAGRVAPTHAVIDGIGHLLSSKARVTIGPAQLGADIPLPEGFDGTGDCSVPIVHEGGQLWFQDSAASQGGTVPPGRTPIDAGDRLSIRCGPHSAEILFARCLSNGSRPT